MVRSEVSIYQAPLTREEMLGLLSLGGKQSCFSYHTRSCIGAQKTVPQDEGLRSQSFSLTFCLSAPFSPEATETRIPLPPGGSQKPDLFSWNPAIKPKIILHKNWPCRNYRACLAWLLVVRPPLQRGPCPTPRRKDAAQRSQEESKQTGLAGCPHLASWH